VTRASRVRRFVCAATVLLLVAMPAAAVPPAPGHAAIASAHPLATAAGQEILAAGGNAFDAAVAVAATLAVVEPSGSGLGGGGFFLLHRVRDGRQIVVDAREVAPSRATRDMYLDSAGNPVPGASTDGPLAAGIPGEPAAFEHLARRYGRLPLARSLAPAIRLARDGFAIDERLVMGLRFRREALRRSPDAARIFLVDGAVPESGYLLRQPELAAVLDAIARDGARAFYSGPLAEKMVAAVQAGGGIWTRDDLARYRVTERQPLVGDYRGHRIVSIPPPSAGGLGLIGALNVLSGFELDRVGPVTRTHLVVESLRRTFRDRGELLGDPAFVAMPVERLLNPYYADGLRVAIRTDRTLPSTALAGSVGEASQGPETTHFSILDRAGNRVAATISLNQWFGSAWMIPGAGVLLNNTMDDFAIKPGVPNLYGLVGTAANAVAPGKRALSSMTPAFIEGSDGLMIAGTPGGSRIISMALLATLDRLAGRSAAQIVAAPRIHHQFWPDVVQYEPGALTDAEIASLAALGHRLTPARMPWGNLQVITWDYASGVIEAASDPRGKGAGHVY
jgi:gamma-glutamyltranspeptidase/glutathione hydrolase